jgi:hypothetical protein
LNKLNTSEKYKGRDCVHTADGNGMAISHVGQFCCTLLIVHCI